ncbi:unnamed protein product [Meganyctiphanes norvegica]|uniref:C2H2-type domain-containing protein n=1 Tax=Meganyctiphanes norvegica TaxID=48144 RepID=A0AAV2QNT5_MEGNR
MQINENLKMNNTDYDENDNDGFECSECDFKCSSENDIIEHSAIHKCQNNVIDSLLDIIENDSVEIETAVGFLSKFNSKNEIESCSSFTDPPDIITYSSSIDNEYKDIDITGNILDNLNTKQTIKSGIRVKYVPDSNGHDNKPVVKTESCFLEEISTDETYHENENVNKKLKVENIQIEHKFISDHSPFHQNEHDIIQPDQNSNNCDKYGNEKLHSECDNVNIFTTNGILSKTNNGDFSGSLSCYNHIEKDKEFGTVFSNIFDVRTLGNRLYLCRLCSYINKSKIDAYSHITEHIQDLYNKLPPTTDLPNKYNYFVCTACHGKIMRRNDIQVHIQTHSTKQISGTVVGVRCEYIDRKHVKKILHCCEVCDFASIKYIDIYRHLRVHNLEEINAADRDKYNEHTNEIDENLLSSFHKDEISGDNDNINNQDIPASKIYTGRSYIKYRGRLQAMEVDNTGKYIPNGWQRKVFRHIGGKLSGDCTVRYISPFGQTLYTAAQVPEYIEWLESQDIMEPIDVEKFDFSWSSHNLPIITLPTNKEKE